MVEQPTARNGTSSSPVDRGPAQDAPLDLGRIGAAIRRDRLLIAAIVLLVSGLVLVVSLLSPPRYHATARISDDPLTSDSLDSATADRRLATSREVVTTPVVLGEAAKSLPGETADTLAGKVSAAVDPTASILDITVSDTDARRAARTAEAVADAFLAESERAGRDSISQAQQRMSDELDLQRRRGASKATIDALRARLSDMAAVGLMSGSGLRELRAAAVPTSAYAPKPLRSTLLALLASLLVAVLIVIARDRLRRAPDARALSDALDLPLIAALPVADSHRLRRAPAELDGAMVEEAALQAAVRAALPPRSQRIVLVHGVGRRAHVPLVAAALARSLAWAGHATVLVRHDPRGERAPRADLLVTEVPVVSCANLEDQLQELKGSDYRYVIVESPDTAPGAQLRGIAPDIAGAVLVARLGSATVDDAMAARRLVDALSLRAIGLVLTCSAADAANVIRAGFAAPVRPRSRARSTAHNGTHPAARELAAPAEADGPPR
jgi:capsular polysaccharide biosynthesis protein